MSFKVQEKFKSVKKGAIVTIGQNKKRNAVMISFSRVFMERYGILEETEKGEKVVGKEYVKMLLDEEARELGFIFLTKEEAGDDRHITVRPNKSSGTVGAAFLRGNPLLKERISFHTVNRVTEEDGMVIISLGD